MSTYKKQTWVNNETPLNAENLNHIEAGIEATSIDLSEVKTDVTGLKIDMGTAKTEIENLKTIASTSEQDINKKLDFETTTDNKITLQSSDRVKLSSSNKLKLGYSPTSNVDNRDGTSLEFEGAKTTLRAPNGNPIFQVNVGNLEDSKYTFSLRNPATNDNLIGRTQAGQVYISNENDTGLYVGPKGTTPGTEAVHNLTLKYDGLETIKVDTHNDGYTQLRIYDGGKEFCAIGDSWVKIRKGFHIQGDGTSFNFKNGEAFTSTNTECINFSSTEHTWLDSYGYVEIGENSEYTRVGSEESVIHFYSDLYCGTTEGTNTEYENVAMLIEGKEGDIVVDTPHKFIYNGGEVSRIFRSLEEVGYSEDTVSEDNPWRPYDFLDYCSVKLKPGDKIILKMRTLYNKVEDGLNLWLLRFLGLRDSYAPTTLDGWKKEESNFIISSILYEQNAIETRSPSCEITILENNITNYKLKGLCNDSSFGDNVNTMEFNAHYDYWDNEMGGYWILNNTTTSLTDYLRWVGYSGIDGNDTSFTYSSNKECPFVYAIQCNTLSNYRSTSSLEYIRIDTPKLYEYINNMVMYFGYEIHNDYGSTVIIERDDSDYYEGAICVTLNIHARQISNKEYCTLVLKYYQNSDMWDTSQSEWQVVNPREVILYEGQPTYYDGDEGNEEAHFEDFYEKPYLPFKSLKVEISFPNDYGRTICTELALPDISPDMILDYIRDGYEFSLYDSTGNGCMTLILWTEEYSNLKSLNPVYKITGIY